MIVSAIDLLIGVAAAVGATGLTQTTGGLTDPTLLATTTAMISTGDRTIDLIEGTGSTVVIGGSVSTLKRSIASFEILQSSVVVRTTRFAETSKTPRMPGMSAVMATEGALTIETAMGAGRRRELETERGMCARSTGRAAEVAQPRRVGRRQMA